MTLFLYCNKFLKLKHTLYFFDYPLHFITLPVRIVNDSKFIFFNFSTLFIFLKKACDKFLFPSMPHNWQGRLLAKFSLLFCLNMCIIFCIPCGHLMVAQERILPISHLSRALRRQAMEVHWLTFRKIQAAPLCYD